VSADTINKGGQEIARRVSKIALLFSWYKGSWYLGQYSIQTYITESIIKMSRIQYLLFEQSVRIPDELTCKNSDSAAHPDLKIVVEACNLVARHIWASHRFIPSLSFCRLISEYKSYVCRQSIKCSVRQTFCIQMNNLHKCPCKYNVRHTRISQVCVIFELYQAISELYWRTTFESFVNANAKKCLNCLYKLLEHLN
jgi:hypothetical protein